MEGERMLTVKQAAEQLQVGIVTVRRWIQSGKLKATRIGGDRAGYRIAESEVRRVLRGEA